MSYSFITLPTSHPHSIPSVSSTHWKHISTANMPVTELAILPLTHRLTKECPILPTHLLQKLQTAKSVLETASRHSFYYFQQVEDPSIIYILGSWESVTAHWEFLPSPENQEMLELLKDDIVMPGEGVSDVLIVERSWMIADSDSRRARAFPCGISTTISSSTSLPRTRFWLLPLRLRWAGTLCQKTKRTPSIRSSRKFNACWRVSPLLIK